MYIAEVNEGSTPRQSGITETDNMMYVKASERDVPWHGLGTPIANAVSSAEAVMAAGLDWGNHRPDGIVGRGVELRPEIQLFNGEYREVPGRYQVTRMDNGAVLGNTTERYYPIQNEQAFEFVDSIIGSGEVLFETAGSLFGGERVFMLARLPQDIKVAGEAINPYLVLTNAHNGKNALLVTETPIRVVCQNTLNAALRGSKRSVKIRHSAQSDQRLADARKVLGFTKQYFESFEKFATELVKAKMTKAAFEAFLNELIPIPEVKEGESTRGKTMAENTQEKILTVYQADNLNNIRGTKWGAYNAIADYADWSRTLKKMGGVVDPTSGKKVQSQADVLADLERNWTRTFEGTALKDEALVLLTA